MSGRTPLAATVAALVVLGVGAASGRLKPLPKADAVSSHSPFEMGECHICHQGNDPSHPGPVSRPSAQLCGDCHDDLASIQKGHPARGNCTACHSPHNSKKRKLLL